MTLRRASADDAALITKLHSSSRQLAYRGLMPDEFLDGPIAQARAGRLEALMAGEDRPATLLAYSDGELVGFCAVRTPSRDDDATGGEADISLLYVGAGGWGLGIGRLLMSESLDAFRRDGFTIAALWMLEGNARARAFYNKFGFIPDGARKPHESGAVEVRLKLALDAAAL